jgi:hypothetical protein
LSKILKNSSGSSQIVDDTGVTIPNATNYTIPPTDYTLWASSSNVITKIGAALLVVNDGSTDLSISDGTDLIKGNYPKKFGVQDGSFNDITSTVVNSSRGLDSAPNKYAPNVSVSGSLTALNSVVTATSLDGFGSAGIVITGTWVGTITFQGSVDGSSFVDMFAQPIGNGLIAQTITANGSLRINTTGLKAIRVKMTGYTSGTATVAIQLTPYAGFIRSLTSLIGATDGTQIGNVGDAIKIAATITVASSTFGAIFRRQEISVATKVETDLPSGSYTVPSGKTFVLTSINGNYDTQSPLVIRFKKQTGGSGAFATEWRLTLKQHGQDNSNVGFQIPYGIVMGAASDVLKLTYESALAKGSLWSSFTGLEY